MVLYRLARSIPSILRNNNSLLCKNAHLFRSIRMPTLYTEDRRAPWLVTAPCSCVKCTKNLVFKYIEHTDIIIIGLASHTWKLTKCISEGLNQLINQIKNLVSKHNQHHDFPLQEGGKEERASSYIEIRTYYQTYVSSRCINDNIGW